MTEPPMTEQLAQPVQDPLRIDSPADLQRVMRTSYAPSAQQWEAISAPLSPAVVIAGAGSGKTTLMAARVVYLVLNGCKCGHPGQLKVAQLGQLIVIDKIAVLDGIHPRRDAVGDAVIARAMNHRLPAVRRRVGSASARASGLTAAG